MIKSNYWSYCHVKVLFYPRTSVSFMSVIKVFLFLLIQQVAGASRNAPVMVFEDNADHIL